MAVRHHVLIVAHSGREGGAEYCLDTVLRHLDRERFDATVVFPFEGPLCEAARGYGYDVRTMPLCHWLYLDKRAWHWKNLIGRSWANVLRLRALIQESRADIVYTNTSAVFESAFAARLAKVPHVWHVHEVLADRNRMQQLLPLPFMKRLIYRLSDSIVFESHSARRVFESSTPPDKSVVIYNSLRLVPEETDRTGDNHRTRFGLRAGDRVLGFVGQFIDRKNPLALIRAIAKVKSMPGLKCLFAGHGPLEAVMRQEMERLGLVELCHIIGFQIDVAPIMNAIDVLLLLSRQESFGLVLVEAAAYGKPAIACVCEGPGEIVVDGETGLLVPQGDDEALARAIERVFANDGERRRMGEGARRRAADLFCPVNNTRKLEQTWSEAIEQRDPRAHSRSPIPIPLEPDQVAAETCSL